VHILRPASYDEDDDRDTEWRGVSGKIGDVDDKVEGLEEQMTALLDQNVNGKVEGLETQVATLLALVRKSDIASQSDIGSHLDTGSRQVLMSSLNGDDSESDDEMKGDASDAMDSEAKEGLETHMAALDQKMGQTIDDKVEGLEKQIAMLDQKMGQKIDEKVVALDQKMDLILRLLQEKM
jgi:hypothetical protein